MTLSDLGAQAVAYAEGGARVFPLRPRRKERLYPTGFKIASADPTQVAAWWRQVPTANIGLHPGTSGRIVFDSDGPEGETFGATLGLLDDPPTLTVRTGRREGGRHRHFVRPAFAVGNLKLPGIDVRCDGGYVLMPPSVHPSGRVYAWEDVAAELRPLPAAALAALETASTAAPQPTGHGSAAVPKGQRNSHLTSLAVALRRHGLDVEALREALRAINAQQCDPPLSAREVDRIAASVARYDAAAIPGDIRERTTDLANARRLTAQYADEFLCVPGLGWLNWDGARFASRAHGRGVISRRHGTATDRKRAPYGTHTALSFPTERKP